MNGETWAAEDKKCKLPSDMRTDEFKKNIFFSVCVYFEQGCTLSVAVIFVCNRTYFKSCTELFPFHSAFMFFGKAWIHLLYTRVTPPPKKKKTEPINFFWLLLQKSSKIILILYTETSEHVSEYYGLNFSCTESTSYPEKKEKARIKFMNFSQTYMDSVFFFFFFFFGGGGNHPVWINRQAEFFTFGTAICFGEGKL